MEPKLLSDIAQELNGLGYKLRKLENTIKYLNLLQKELSYNLGFLKKKSVIAVIEGYKESLKDLNRILKKRKEFEKDKEKIKNLIKEKISLSNQMIAELEKDQKKILPFKRK